MGRIRRGPAPHESSGTREIMVWDRRLHSLVGPGGQSNSACLFVRRKTVLGQRGGIAPPLECE